MKRYTKTIYILSLFLIQFLLISNSFAFRFTPMSLTLNKENKTGMVKLENDTNEPMAIELSIGKRIQDLKGKEKQPLVKDGIFSIFPSQIILRPQERRSVKVSYIGELSFKEEKSFRLIAEQLPIQIDQKKKGTGIKVLLKYVGSLYVNPGKTKAVIKVTKIKKKNKKLFIQLQNKGTKHLILENVTLSFTSKKSKKEVLVLNEKDLHELAGKNILAGSERLFVLAWPKSLKQKAKDFKVEIAFDQN